MKTLQDFIVELRTEEYNPLIQPYIDYIIEQLEEIDFHYCDGCVGAAF